MGRKGTCACVGIDPVFERLPEAVRAEHWEPVRAIEAFSRAVLDEVSGVVGIVKFQSACFERYGAGGVAALERCAAHAKRVGLVVILDAKRGDIGISAAHYAAAARALQADAITVNAYLGTETVEPYLAAGLGVFVLVRTSNTASDEIQSERLSDGRTVAELMAGRVARLGERFVGESGYSEVGAVVAATKPGDAQVLRALMPRQLFLVPGFGAQGGTVEDVRVMADDRGGGVIVSASRSVLYPQGEGPWREEIAAAARRFVEKVHAISSR